MQTSEIHRYRRALVRIAKLNATERHHGAYEEIAREALNPPSGTLREAYDGYEADKAAAKAKFALAVSEARKTRSLSDIAQELGVSRQRVQQISQGR